MQDNGGFTQTHALLAGSPAIDAGDNSVGLTEDQRRYARPIDGDGDATATIDIGAFEYTPGSLGTVNEFLVNDGHQAGIQETSGEFDHSQRAVAVADDGSYVVVWSSEGQDASGWGVYAQRFSKIGSELTGEILVNEIQAGNEQWARVASDGSGNFVATWTSGHSGNLDVYARRFDSSGTALGGEFRVNTTAAGHQNDSSIAMDAFGNFVVVWEGQGSGDSSGVLYRRFFADGTEMDVADVRVNQSVAGTDDSVSVAMNAAGDFVVVWVKDDEIRYQMFDKDGAIGAGDIVYAGQHASSPDVAMDAQGNFVVVYRWNDAWGRGTWGHKFDSTGTEQLPWFRIGPGINNNDNRDHDNPSITMDDFGNFIVTYESVAEGEPGNNTVFAERFLADKTSLGRFQVNQTTAGDQHMASIAMLDLDNYVVAFTGEDADQTGIYARSFGTTPNSEPTLTTTADNPTFTEGGAAAGLFSATSVSTIESGQTITGLTLTVTNVNDGGNEKLNIDGSSLALTDGNTGITATNSLSYSISLSGTTATVTLTGGTMSTAATQTLVDAISYQNDSDNPNTDQPRGHSHPAGRFGRHRQWR